MLKISIQNVRLISKNEESEQRLTASGFLGKAHAPLASLSAIQTPAIGDESDSDVSIHGDDENRPLTQAELMQKILNGVCFYLF